MEQYNFSNENIDIVCDKVIKFLEKSGVDKHEVLRIRLIFEEILLDYQEKFGEDATYNLKLVKRFSALRIEIVIQGECFNPLEKDDEDGILISSLLAGIGLAPTWSYKNGKNFVVFIPKKKPASQTVKMLVAMALSVIAGFLLTLLPDNIRNSVSEYFLTPVTDLFMGLISAVSGPLVFLSVLGSICSMGNMETLGRIGKKTILTILGASAFIGALLTLIATAFYKVTFGGGTNSDFTQIFALIYDIVPKNLLEPFITGNSLQIIFIAVIFGVSMLMLSSKVSGVFTIVEQFNSIIQTVMSGVSSFLHIAIFVIFTDMISSGKFKDLIGSYKIILIMLLSIVLYLVGMFLWITIRKKVSPAVLIKKILPTFMIALTTASSAAAFSTNVRDAHQKLGIDKKVVDFGIPLGQVLFKPGIFALIIAMQLTFAENYGIDITIPWLILAYVTNFLVSFAIPPVSGGALMGFTVAFTQTGIPLEVLGIAIALDAITDFPDTAMNITGWQLTLIDVADSLGLLDKEILREDETKASKRNYC